MIPQFTGRHWTQTRARWELALAEGDWQEAERQSLALLDESALDPFNHDLARASLAILDATRGRAGRALNTLSVMCEDEVSRERIPLSRVAQHVLSMAQESTPAFPMLPMDYDSTAMTSVWKLIWAAESNRLDHVDSLLATMKRLDSPSWKRYKQMIPYAQACLLGHRGDWGEAVEQLRSIASGPTAEPVGFLAVDWLLGIGLEQLGDLPSAAVQFERIQTGERCWTWRDWMLRPVYQPYALRKLVLLYCRMGWEEDARRCWEMLRTTMTDPDPELRPMLDEAALALDALRRT
jgi:hypothetical protein